jgi:hypothetical protein
MIRGMGTTIVLGLVAGSLATVLFFVKHEVKEQEVRLAELNREIRQGQENIHVLKAEWSYLNDPVRLRQLSEHYLSMRVMAPSQVSSLADLPMAADAVPTATAQVKDQLPAPAKARTETAHAPQPVTKPAAKPLPAASVAHVPTPQPIPALTVPSRPVGTGTTAKPQPGRTIVIQSPALAQTPQPGGGER